MRKLNETTFHSLIIGDKVIIDSGEHATLVSKSDAYVDEFTKKLSFKFITESGVEFEKVRVEVFSL